MQAGKAAEYGQHSVVELPSIWKPEKAPAALFIISRSDLIHFPDNRERGYCFIAEPATSAALSRVALAGFSKTPPADATQMIVSPAVLLFRYAQSWQTELRCNAPEFPQAF